MRKWFPSRPGYKQKNHVDKSIPFDVIKSPQYHFTERWMYMHTLAQAVYITTARHGVDNFLNKLRGIGAYNVKPQYLIGTSINYSLGKAFLFPHSFTLG